jgi:hypothetical protein
MAFLLIITFSGVSFFIPYMMIEWVFNLPVPRLDVLTIFGLGTLSTVMFGLSTPLINFLTVEIKLKKGVKIDE